MADNLNVLLAPQFVINIVHEMGGAGGFTIVAGIASTGSSGSSMTGAQIKTAYENEADTNAFDDAAVSKLAGIDTGAKDDQTGAEIKTAYELEADTNAYDDAAVSKLAGIDTGAKDDQTPAEIRTAVAAATDSNVFTDSQQTSLGTMEDNATADQTDAQIRTAVANATDSNVFQDADASKLDGIESGATTDQTDSEIETAYNAQVAVASAQEMTDGTEVAIRRFSPDNIENMIAIHGSGGGGMSDAEVKTAYENNANTNEFDDTEQSKLAGIEDSADVTDASNVAAAGAVMDGDFTAGEGILRKTGAGAYVAMKSNLGAATNPIVTSDTAAGYVVGSRWINTTLDREYVCLDATNGAAVWTETTGAGGGGMSDSEVKTAYENNANTNEFSDAEKTSLGTMEDNATADQTNAEIRTAVGAATDSNVYDDAAVSSLASTVTVANDALPKAGGVLSGELIVQYGVPSIRLNEDDQAAGDDNAKFYMSNGIAYLQGTANGKLRLSGYSSADLTLFEARIGGAWKNILHAGSGVDIKAAYEAEANAYTDSKDTKLGTIEDNATADQTGAEIKTAYQSEANAYTDTKNTKLAGIDTGAKDDQTGAEIKSAYEGEANAFTDAKNTKLTSIEDSATADQSNAEIRTAVAAATNSNVFTDAEQTSLGTMEDNATADQSDSEIATAYGNQVGQVSGGEITAGTEPTLRTYAPDDIVAFIAAHETGGGSSTEINTQTASYTLALTDAEDIVEMNVATANVLTIPLNATVAFDVPTIISVTMLGAGVTTITAVAGVLLNGVDGGSEALGATFDGASLYQRATDDWVIQGAINSPTGMTDEEVKTAYENNADTNEFDDAEQTKLAGIEDSATTDQTDAEIRTAVEAASDSNVFTDNDHSKLDAIEASADVTDTANVTAAGAAMLDGAVFTGTVETDGKLQVDDVITTPPDVITSETGIGLSMTGENKKTLVLDHTATITVSGAVASQIVEIEIEQGSTGGTAAWAGVAKWYGGAAPTLSTTQGQVDTIILQTRADSSVIGLHIGVAS